MLSRTASIPTDSADFLFRVRVNPFRMNVDVFGVHVNRLQRCLTRATVEVYRFLAEMVSE